MLLASSPAFPALLPCSLLIDRVDTSVQNVALTPTAPELPLKTLLQITVIVCLGAAVGGRAAELVSGSIKAVQGSCSVQRGTEAMTATQGMHLMEKDVLITGPDGYVAVMMRDGTRLSLSPETKLTIDQFTYDPSANKFALFLDLGRGVMAYVSGKIAHFSPEAVRIQTPVGSIGTRGTRFVVGLDVTGRAQ